MERKYIDQIYTEVVTKLTAAEAGDKKSGFSDLKKYIGTNYDFIGISTPAQRAVFKNGYSFSGLSLPEQLLVWDQIWQRSTRFEVLGQCIYFIEKNLLLLPFDEVWNITKNWVTKIDNWAHSDGLSDIYAHLMEKNPEMVYSQFEKWNISVNPWERRQSVVGMLLYSKKRKAVLPAARLLRMVEPLLKDEDYFVQKGVGWSLREIGNVYPEETIAFLKQYCGILHPAAFSPAIEKLTSEEKDLLKQLRKQSRQR